MRSSGNTFCFLSHYLTKHDSIFLLLESLLDVNFISYIFLCIAMKIDLFLEADTQFHSTSCFFVLYGYDEFFNRFELYKLLTFS